VAALHTGHYPNLAEAARHMVRLAGVIEPNPASRRAYEDHYRRYLATYPALRALMR
jgi:sugar (pentulose or hexulose) kinase